MIKFINQATISAFLMFAIPTLVVVVIVIGLLSIPIQTTQGALKISPLLITKDDSPYNNGTNNDTHSIINELRKSRSILEESAPRQVVLSIVSFFVAIAFTIFGIQLAFRPQKAEIKYFIAAILSLIIPVSVLLITFVGSNVLGVQTFGLISKNIWLFASLMLLIPIFTLIILMILHRLSREPS